MRNLSHKSGSRMRDDVQTNQLKCLDMEGKIARHAQQRQQLEDQVSCAVCRMLEAGSWNLASCLSLAVGLLHFRAWCKISVSLTSHY